MLTACDNSEPIIDLSNNTSEVKSSSIESTPETTNTNNSSENVNSNAESKSEEETKDKIKNDGELNDGIEWGPLED